MYSKSFLILKTSTFLYEAPDIVTGCRAQRKLSQFVLFEQSGEIKIMRDRQLYLTKQNISENLY